MLKRSNRTADDRGGLESSVYWRFFGVSSHELLELCHWLEAKCGVDHPHFAYHDL
jgi:hypothetical protein